MPKIRCKEAERRALLKIKEDLQEYEDDARSSWGKEEEKRECCEWIGIRCDNRTSHIISLDLSFPTFLREKDSPWSLRGNISSSLADLEYLNYLALSFIKFYYNSIPSFIGTFSKLRYLNLSFTSLSGEVPPQLGKLSSLQVLYLKNTDLEIRNLEWASRCTSLQLLDLNSTNISRAQDWVQVVNNLPCLTTLVLSNAIFQIQLLAISPLPILQNFFQSFIFLKTLMSVLLYCNDGCSTIVAFLFILTSLIVNLIILFQKL